MRSINILSVLGVCVVCLAAGNGSAAPAVAGPTPAPRLQLPTAIALATPDAYDIVELPPLAQWPDSIALAISASNKVAGYVRNAAGTAAVAVVWTNGQPTVVGGPNCANSFAHDFGPNDAPVGSCGTNHGFIGTAGVPALVLGAGPSGKAVGMTPIGKAWVNPTAPAPLGLGAAPPAPGGPPTSIAVDMNAARKSVGFVGPIYNGVGPARAVMWNDTGVAVPLPGRSMASVSARASAINDSNLIVGRVGIGGAADERAAQWQNGTMTELGSLGGRSGASDVNGAGAVVGWSYDGDGDLRAFLYKDGKMRDLNSLVHRTPTRNQDGTWNVAAEWVLQSANAINDAGYICGQGTKDGKVRGYMLKPRTGGTVISSDDLKKLIAAIKPTRTLAEGKDTMPGFAQPPDPEKRTPAP